MLKNALKSKKKCRLKQTFQIIDITVRYFRQRNIICHIHFQPSQVLNHGNTDQSFARKEEFIRFVNKYKINIILYFMINKILRLNSRSKINFDSFLNHA